MPPLTGAPCARSTAGAATAAAPSAVVCRKRRRLMGKRDIRALLEFCRSLTLLQGAFYNSVGRSSLIGAYPCRRTSVGFAGRCARQTGLGMTDPQTIIDKLWAAHEILRRDDGESLLWVDRHYVHEGSFHAFGKLAARGIKVAEPGLTFGVADHYVPTRGSRTNIANPELARMVRQVEENTAKHGIRLFGIGDPRQGIVHVVGPEQGLT